MKLVTWCNVCILWTVSWQVRWTNQATGCLFYAKVVYKCFMLRAWRRLSLARRLTKCRVDSEETVDTDAVLCSVVELLDDHQLETLVTAVETGGSKSHANECILVDDSAHFAPQITCCRLWRWPFLQNIGDIRCVPWCQNKHGGDGVLEDNQSVCCHPFHWSHHIFPGDTL